MDSPKVLTNWKKSKELSYNLLSDPSQALIKVLGGSQGAKKVQRSHFILEKGTGKLLLASLGVKPAESAKACLATIKAL
jgi:peroxiredoxin Q/BCP